MESIQNRKVGPRMGKVWKYVLKSGKPYHFLNNKYIPWRCTRWIWYTECVSKLYFNLYTMFTNVTNRGFFNTW